MEEYTDHSTTLVSKVDCTSENSRALCEKVGVQGYPTIKYGNPDDLQPYEGGRDIDSLKAHIKSLKPLCNITDMSNCSEEERVLIEKYSKMDASDIKKELSQTEELQTRIEQDFKVELSKLQTEYEQLIDTKKDSLEKLARESYTGLKKSILKNLSPPTSDKDKSDL